MVTGGTGRTGMPPSQGKDLLDYFSESCFEVDLLIKQTMPFLSSSKSLALAVFLTKEQNSE